MTDPHAWQDLENGHRYVVNIETALAKVDPTHAADYQAAARAYLAAIDAMDREIRSEIAEVPPERRRVVSCHDAFGYFGQAYGVEFVALQGISEDAEPSAADLRLLIDQVRREQIKVLFFENALSPRLVQQIGGHQLHLVDEVADAIVRSRRAAPDDSHHAIPLVEQEFREVRPILARDAGDERGLHCVARRTKKGSPKLPSIGGAARRPITRPRLLAAPA